MSGHGPKRGFLFDEHRLALGCWAEVARTKPGLITFDRHFDLVPPRKPPAPGWSSAHYDAHARSELDPRNVDHVLAAMEAGLIGDVLVVARAWPDGATRASEVTTCDGTLHRILKTATLEKALESPSTMDFVQSATALILDVDLDCFTTPSDADPFTLIPWPRDVIRAFLTPLDSRLFWESVLSRCVGLTCAREPLHCGGVVAANRLFEDVAQILFVEIFGADLP